MSQKRHKEPVFSTMYKVHSACMPHDVFGGFGTALPEMIGVFGSTLAFPYHF